MAEQTPPTPAYYEDMIDLRALITTLWNAKWIIIGATLLAGLAAFLVSAFVLPEKYEAAAIVTITDPAIRAELENSIQSAPVQLDINGFTQLAESDAVIAEVKGTLGIEPGEEGHSLKMEAALQGKSQLQLKATAEDPELAAQAANAWAGVMVERLNELYGTSLEQVALLEAEVQRAEGKWGEAEAALQEALGENQAQSLQVQLTAAENGLNLVQSRLAQNQLLLLDAGTLTSQLAEVPVGDVLSQAQALSLITLQQRAVATVSTSFGASWQETSATSSQESTGGIGLQVQLPGGPESVTAGAARDELAGFREALLGTNQELESRIAAQKDRLDDLRVQLEREQYQLDQLIEKRDLARKAYSALAGQLEETRINQAQRDNAAKIGVRAIVPEKPNGLSSIVICVLAGIVGLIIAISGEFVYFWWTVEEESVKKTIIG